jgi:GTP-binding protein EngB required for normal cell division
MVAKATAMEGTGSSFLPIHEVVPLNDVNVTDPSSHLYQSSPIPHLRNVVIFGESGAGKSSIVNMLAGEEVFKVASGASGTTFEHQGCVINFNQRAMNVYDTAGLNEAEIGKLSPQQALQQLYDLLRDLGGINLLVFVTRFRITNNTVDNFRLIRGVFCGEKVPVVVAITGREFESDNDGWWAEWKKRFEQNGMTFNDYAIGTANQHLTSDPTYSELRTRLQLAIHKYGHQARPRYMPSATHIESGEPLHRWFESAVVQVFGQFRRLFGRSKSDLLQLYLGVLLSNSVPQDQAMLSMERVRVKVA